MVCEYSDKCGGCSLLDVSYEEQVRNKSRLFEDSVRAAVSDSSVSEGAGEGVSDFEILPPVFAEQFGYRSRARFRYSKEGLSFYEKRTNTPVIIKKCPVLDEKMNAFIANPPRLNLWELPDGELSCISTDKGIAYNSGVGWVSVKDKKIPVSGDVFFQSNRLLLPSLIDFVLDNVKGPSVMDLYSGVGTFSAFLEDKYDVTAVEINRKCLSLAKQHLKKTHFFASPVEKWKGKARGVNTVIADPPRVGLEKSVPGLIASWNPDRIIYVSCYLKTLVRDLKIFASLGYRAVKGRFFDFYPNTEHMETVVLMSRI